MKIYTVKEIFPTLQGEGVNAGRRSIFVRLAGCNLWTGRPEDRLWGKGACSRWCDTSFVGGVKFNRESLVAEINSRWPGSPEGRFLVFTGGEPFLQLDKDLIWGLKDKGWEVAVETNATVSGAPYGVVDHLCVSPKLGTNIRINGGHELKVILPGHVDPNQGWTDEDLEALAQGSWGAKFVQPQDAIDPAAVDRTYLKDGNFLAGLAEQFNQNLKRCLEFIQDHPDWRLSLQTHKYINLP